MTICGAVMNDVRVLVGIPLSEDDGREADVSSPTIRIYFKDSEVEITTHTRHKAGALQSNLEMKARRRTSPR